jgi:sulfate adenylyltransferase subunit 2
LGDREGAVERVGAAAAARASPGTPARGALSAAPDRSPGLPPAGGGPSPAARHRAPGLDHLSRLESQSIYIIREAFHKLDNLAMLWSIGKDSTVLLWLARKAFFGHVPFPLVHVDTTYKIPSMIEHRDRLCREWNLQLVVGRNDAVLASGLTYPNGRATRVECCGTLKKDALKAVLDAHGYTGVMVGVRRDEEPTRAKERYFSPRDTNMEWNVEDQPPELWDLFATDFAKGAHIRVHPLLHWSELNVWEYIERENIPVIPLYFANERGERYRSLGCHPCTSPIKSSARSVRDIIEELRHTNVPERSGRAQDKESEDAFERLRRDGYM